MPTARPTIPALVRRVADGERLVMLTAYDAAFARLVEAAGIDLVLVGDSVGMTLLGHDSTIPVTMDDMVRHTAAVVRATRAVHVVCDLPFLSGHAGDVFADARRAMQEGGASSVKLEGGRTLAPVVARLVDAGVPVMGHVGLRPQQSAVLGGYPAQGRSPADADALFADAEALVAAGAWALVLEKMPAELAAAVTAHIGVPTIGIGAGAGCSGQVQVLHDLLGLDPTFRPRHAGRYADLAAPVTDAIARYAADVRTGAFPTETESVHADDALRAWLAERASGQRRPGGAGAAPTSPDAP